MHYIFYQRYNFVAYSRLAYLFFKAYRNTVNVLAKETQKLKFQYLIEHSESLAISAYATYCNALKCSTPSILYIYNTSNTTLDLGFATYKSCKILHFTKRSVSRHSGTG